MLTDNGTEHTTRSAPTRVAAAGGGRRCSFAKFMLYGMPIMIMTVIVSTIYVWLRYYVPQI